MNKIVIIGSPGAGKTTLAQVLGSILDIKVIYLDRIFWKRGWQSISGDERIDILQELVPDTRWPDGRWIMEGTYLLSSGPRLEAADTIVFLDLHPLLCLGRVIQRHYANHGQVRKDLPKECTDKLTFSRMWYVLTFPYQERKKLLENLHSYASKKEIIHLCSPEEVEDFVRKLKEAKEGLSTSDENLSLTFAQKVSTETKRQWQHIVNTSAALVFFTYASFALLLYTLAPKTFFSLRAKIH